MIRRATRQDASAIFTLYRSLMNDPAIEVLGDQVDNLSKSSHSYIWVYELNGAILGTALMSLCEDVMYGNKPFAIIENLVISESCRGQGIGKAMLDHIERFCDNSNCSEIMILSSSYRNAAHQFFSARGYDGNAKRGFVKARASFGESVASSD